MADNVAVTPGTGTSIATDDIGGVQHQRVKVEYGGDGSATDVSLTTPMPVTVTDGTSITSVFPGTFQRVTDEPKQLFYDPFDTALETANFWTTPTIGTGGVLATVTTGIVTLGTGTTASGWSKLFSQPSFKPVIPGWIGYSFAIDLPDGGAPTANTYRFWGAGTPATTPTAAAPLTNAVGFELATDGKLYAVVYAGGVRTVVQNLSSTGNSKQPLDANGHRYIVYVRTDRAYWYIDGLNGASLVATSSFQGPQVQTLPITFLAVANTVAPTASGSIRCHGAAVWDTTKANSHIADPEYSWRRARVTAAGGVTTVPGQASSASVTAVSDAAVNTMLLAANTNRRGVIIHNNSTSILYVKYGATASLTSYTYKVPADATLEMAQPVYAGQIDGIWSADSTGSAYITELI